MRAFFLAILFSILSVQTSAFGHSYQLKPGDTLEVSVWQDQKLGRQIVIGPDGRVSFPLAGHLRAAGSTLEALESKLRQRLKKFYTEDLDITVLLVNTTKDDDEFEKIIYVTGEVRRPGPFVIKKRTTVLQALALSGGLGPFAAKTRIQIRRKVDGSNVLMPFNYKNAEKGRDLTGNVYLHDGDVVVVPERGLFE